MIGGYGVLGRGLRGYVYESAVGVFSVCGGWVFGEVGEWESYCWDEGALGSGEAPTERGWEAGCGGGGAGAVEERAETGGEKSG